MLFRRKRGSRAGLGPKAGNLHLIRHGEVDNPDHVVYALLDGFHLTELGRSQAAATAEHLGDREIAAVFTSPLARAVETAAAIAAPHALDPIVDDRLVEWRLSERWQGIVWEDLPTRRPGELEAYLGHPEDLPFSPESLGELAERVSTAIRDLWDQVKGGDVVVVGHQDPTQAARLTLTGRGFESFHSNKPGHAGVITLVSNIASDAMSDSDWLEATYWEPEQGAPFPPKR